MDLKTKATFTCLVSLPLSESKDLEIGNSTPTTRSDTCRLKQHKTHSEYSENINSKGLLMTHKLFTNAIPL